VNGRYEELVDLLKELGYQTTPEIAHPGGRKLVFLGDLADGGPGDTNIFRLVMSAVDGGVSYSVPGDCDTPIRGEYRVPVLPEGFGKSLRFRQGRPGGGTRGNEGIAARTRLSGGARLRAARRWNLFSIGA
jgi:hypothetical protein